MIPIKRQIQTIQLGFLPFTMELNVFNFEFIIKIKFGLQNITNLKKILIMDVFRIAKAD